MSYTDWNTVASLNVTIDGINIAEGSPAGNMNDAVRAIMAGVAELADDMPDTSSLAPKDGAVFEGVQPRFTGRGAYRHNASAALTSGQEYFLVEGSSYPSSPVAGDVVNFYSE